MAFRYSDTRRIISALHGILATEDDGGVAQTGDTRPLERTAIIDAGNVHAAECHGSPVDNRDVRLRATSTTNFVSVNQHDFFGICCDFRSTNSNPSCVERYVVQIDDGLPVAIVCTRAIGFDVPAYEFIAFACKCTSVQGLRRVHEKVLCFHRVLAAIGVERHSVGCPIRRIIDEWTL